jgi:hypothetical protein
MRKTNTSSSDGSSDHDVRGGLLFRPCSAPVFFGRTPDCTGFLRGFISRAPPFTEIYRHACAARTQHPCMSFRPTPGLTRLDPGESRNPVNYAVHAFTPSVAYWIPARASSLVAGSLGRDDNPYAIRVLTSGREQTEFAALLITSLWNVL